MANEFQQQIESAKQSIQLGSKSFALSSLLLGPEQRWSCHFLYSWCRYCDDQVDDARNCQEAQARLEELRQKTHAAFEGRAEPGSVFYALQVVVSRYSIPRHYADELLEGMRMDAEGFRYETETDLLLYSYRVAGVVGLMMTHIMGINKESALQNASDMGTAMQLTNFSRDVMEDALMGRVYFPRVWCREEGFTESEDDLPGAILDPARRLQVVRLTRRLLTLADRFYRSGKAGVPSLPVRSGIAVGSAMEIYSAIGDLVKRRGVNAWDSRAYTTKTHKIWLVAKASFHSFGILVSRTWNNSKRVTIQKTLKFGEGQSV